MYWPVCGKKLKLVKTTEDSAIKPASLYAFTKYTQEMMLHTMCPALGVDYTIFRFQNVYGVGQSLKNPYTGILSIFSSTTRFLQCVLQNDNSTNTPQITTSSRLSSLSLTILSILSPFHTLYSPFPFNACTSPFPSRTWTFFLLFYFYL